MKAQGYYGLLRQLTKGGGTPQLAKQKAVTTVGLEVPEEKAVLSTQQELWLQKRMSAISRSKYVKRELLSPENIFS